MIICSEVCQIASLKLKLQKARYTKGEGYKNTFILIVFYNLNGYSFSYLVKEMYYTVWYMYANLFFFFFLLLIYLFIFFIKKTPIYYIKQKYSIDTYFVIKGKKNMHQTFIVSNLYNTSISIILIFLLTSDKEVWEIYNSWISLP